MGTAITPHGQRDVHTVGLEPIIASHSGRDDGGWSYLNFEEAGRFLQMK
jgi:hypothetical protein